MVIWSGWGIIVPVIYLLVITIFRETLKMVGVDDNIALSAGVLTAAVAVWFAGKRLNNSDRDKTSSLQKRHTLFWLKVEYWAFIIPVILGAIVVINH